jgi:hypothetical protein
MQHLDAEAKGLNEQVEQLGTRTFRNSSLCEPDRLSTCADRELRNWTRLCNNCCSRARLHYRKVFGVRRELEISGFPWLRQHCSPFSLAAYAVVAFLTALLGIVLWIGLTYTIFAAFTVKRNKPALEEGLTDEQPRRSPDTPSCNVGKIPSCLYPVSVRIDFRHCRHNRACTLTLNR